METTRVDISYRPLRIGWAIQSGDLLAFRQAVQYSHALWGGRFNPILLADREAEARQLVETYRVDLIWPLGSGSVAKEFAKKFPHLVSPFMGGDPIGGGDETQVLDMHNAMAYFHDKPEWKALCAEGVALYDWAPDDPLRDVFLVQLGAYPDVADVKTDYRKLLASASAAKELTIENGAELPEAIVKCRSIAFLSRFGIQRRRDMDAGFNPGFYVGDAADLHDLVSFWNLRAADVPLYFIDRKQISRYGQLIAAWEKVLGSSPDRGQPLTLWSRGDPRADAALFANPPRLLIPVSAPVWSNRVPAMELDETTVLGVVGSGSGNPRVSFAYGGKPFNGEAWFYQQKLVASISCIGGLHHNAQHTLSPPFVPELNEFYGRRMLVFDYSKLRIEPVRIGLIIGASDHDGSLDALPFGDLMEEIFRLGGYGARLSSGGLIARQLIARLDGLQGGRVFKIPGVRRLIKTHGPGTPFSKKNALQLIGGKDPDNPGTNFSHYEHLHIERRSPGTKLTAPSVLGYLVEKGLFRIGAELQCPACRMASWVPVDQLKQRVVCELCGHEHDATRRLLDAQWMLRRSGVLGAERNAMGAIPVVLTLQQMDVTFHGSFGRTVYSPSLDLVPLAGTPGAPCEIDFVWLMSRARWDSERATVVLGECKDKGSIDAATFDHLRELADSLPSGRFEVFIVLAKLCPFTPDEIARAKTLNSDHRPRVILLTDRELEPYDIFERTKKECVFTEVGHSPEGLAVVTAQIYFQDGRPIPVVTGSHLPPPTAL